MLAASILVAASSAGALPQAEADLALNERFFSAPHFEPGVSVDELLTRPLIVNGQEIPLTELKRSLCFGAGTYLVDAKKFEVMIAQELEGRIAAGQDVSGLEITDEVFEKRLAKERKKFEDDYPTLDFETEVRRAFRDFELWKMHLRQTMHFDRIFLPDNPLEWPDVTRGAIIDEAGGDMWYQDAIEVYNERVKLKEQDGLDELPDYPMMYLDIMRSMVMDSLHKFVIIETDPARLEPGVLFTIEGVPVPIDDVFLWLKPYLTWEDVQDARTWLVKTNVIKQDLAAANELLDRATWSRDWGEREAKKIFEARKKMKEREIPDEDPEVRAQKLKEWEAGYRMDVHDYQRLTFDRIMLAVQSEGFPSTEAWAEHKRLMDSYAQRISADLDDGAKLRTILDRTNQITGIGKVDVEVILCSAFDWDNFRWKENGWAEAEAKANDLKAKLDAGADWGKTLDMHSDFWDPPQPTMSPQKPIFGFKFKGRWGPLTRNNLIAKLEESRYTIFLYGDALCDYAFYDLPQTAPDGGPFIGGPLRGPHGYYLMKLNRRTPAASPLNLSEPRHYTLLQEYYLRHRFTQYGRELMAAAEIEGLYGPVEGEEPKGSAR